MTTLFAFSDFGVEHVAMELPLTGDLLQDEDLSVAFAAFCLLPLGCDGAVRPRANETEVTAQFDLQDVELHVEVEQPRFADRAAAGVAVSGLAS